MYGLSPNILIDFKWTARYNYLQNLRTTSWHKVKKNSLEDTTIKLKYVHKLKGWSFVYKFNDLENWMMFPWNKAIQTRSHKFDFIEKQIKTHVQNSEESTFRRRNTCTRYQHNAKIRLFRGGYTALNSDSRWQTCRIVLESYKLYNWYVINCGFVYFVSIIFYLGLVILSIKKFIGYCT